jgi:transcriptional regulator with XRE-family HTH domain
MAPARGVPVNGAAIRALREANDWELGKFAAAIQVSTGYLSNIEAGRRPRVSPEIIGRIKDTLGVPRAAIVGGFPVDDVA